jgi:hypothetical protein
VFSDILRQKRFLAPILIVVALALVGLIIYSTIDTLQKSAMLNIVVAPESSTIKVGNLTFKNGEHKIEPGKYNVIISKDGFVSYEETFTVKKGETKQIQVALAQSDGGIAWYANHPDDDAIFTAIGDREYEVLAKKAREKYPVIQYIPYTKRAVGGMGTEWKIDGQWSSDGRLDYIFVTANSCVDSVTAIYKQEALNYLRSKDIDLSDYVIKYNTLCGNTTSPLTDN